MRKCSFFFPLIVLFYCVSCGYSHSVLSVWHPKSPRQPDNLSPIHLLLELPWRQVMILYLHSFNALGIHVSCIISLWIIGRLTVIKKREVVVLWNYIFGVLQEKQGVSASLCVWIHSRWQQRRCLAPPEVPPGKPEKNHRSNLSWSS